MKRGLGGALVPVAEPDGDQMEAKNFGAPRSASFLALL
ncbi:hypothetical protein K701_26140 [Streptomyces fradiae ATCC 10745 = DSM 40063]|uniref:Uncharacterized protein n=1 Tax=Streptomyces fradiae ATCC 10745 = DSM 40063 TaxID=1319510 RepID=A0A1Y2NVQ0_STRFR|nr:hypothetical protein K701_26140 [Streptomyces fradiae ATCC 10745 = DSM 40063]OSY51585.1 hypothetical protein BG846_02796 [Streptomyces fradiae ATCC 10745 = DSM 40063]